MEKIREFGLEICKNFMKYALRGRLLRKGFQIDCYFCLELQIILILSYEFKNIQKYASIHDNET